MRVHICYVISAELEVTPEFAEEIRTRAATATKAQLRNFYENFIRDSDPKVAVRITPLKTEEAVPVVDATGERLEVI